VAAEGEEAAAGGFPAEAADVGLSEAAVAVSMVVVVAVMATTAMAAGGADDMAAGFALTATDTYL
jgi:hypothetical protein